MILFTLKNTDLYLHPNNSLLWFHIKISLYLSFIIIIIIIVFTGRLCTLWVEEPHAFKGPLQKSVTSGCLSPFLLLKHNISNYCRQKHVHETLFILWARGREIGGKQICWLFSWFHKYCKIQYRRIFVLNVHWDSVGLCCVIMSPFQYCDLHFWIHTVFTYTHIHTRMLTSRQCHPQKGHVNIS